LRNHRKKTTLLPLQSNVTRQTEKSEPNYRYFSAKLQEEIPTEQRFKALTSNGEGSKRKRFALLPKYGYKPKKKRTWMDNQPGGHWAQNANKGTKGKNRTKTI